MGAFLFPSILFVYGGPVVLYLFCRKDKMQRRDATLTISAHVQGCCVVGKGWIIVYY